MQTSILLVLCVIGNMSEVSESKVRDLDHPATVQNAVRTLQTTMKLQLTFVEIFHSLINPHRKGLNVTVYMYTYIDDIKDIKQQQQQILFARNINTI